MTKQSISQQLAVYYYLSSTTRPDIAFAVSNVAKFSANPTKEHWSAVKRILRKGTPDYGLQFSADCSSTCIGFSDADWAGDASDRKSASGYTFQLSGTAISWRSKKQPCLSLSTAEAEYVALSAAAQEALWLKQLLADLNVTQETPMIRNEDNQAAISMCKNPRFHGRAKHIDIKCHFIRDQANKGAIYAVYCPISDMLADMYTKGLPKAQFIKLRELNGVTPELC